MKRVLIFSTAYFPLVGGAEIALRELTARLPDFEFDMVTAAIRPGLPREEQIGRVRVFRLGEGHPVDKYFLPWQGALKAAALHREKPYDVIWSMMASYAGFAAESFKRRHPEVPYLLTLQEGDPPELIAQRVRFVRGWFRKIFRRADAVQAISRFLMDWGRSQGFAGSIAEVIPNGVDLSKFSVRLSPEERKTVRSSFGFADGDFVVVTASRLVEKNAVDLVIRALPHLPENVKFLIAGVGEQEEMLKALVKQLKIEKRVVFGGLADHATLPKWLGASDAFCRPSRSEGMGNSFIEAMAAGLPVVATPVGGIPDIIEDEVNGLLAKPESSSSVAEELGRLAKDAGLRARLISTASDGLRRYDWGEIAARMERLLKKLAKC
jgi:glycosyltransferase involved in cell wall biosynthesis